LVRGGGGANIEVLEPRTLLFSADLSAYPPGPPMSTLVAGNGSVLFFNDDRVHGAELWRSDGTQEGTRLVRDIRPGAAGSVSVPTNPNVYIPRAS
jgi:ELWxxDGT repeat protein